MDETWICVPCANRKFARNYLAAFHIPLINERLGGNLPLKVRMFTHTGQVLVRALPRNLSREIARSQIDAGRALEVVRGAGGTAARGIAAMNKIKVLIVDDSALIRQLLTEILSRDPAIEVVGVAPNPLVAREKVLRLEPDVITLDVEMPQMDGLTFLEKLMRAHPLPVVMISSLTERGCDTTLRALELGAVDFVTKPRIDVADGTVQLADEIVEKVKAAARARVALAAQAREPAEDALATRALAEDHASSHRHGRLDGRNRGLAGGPGTAAGGHARNRDGAAHAGEFHALLRRPPGFPVPRARQGGRRRRPHICRVTRCWRRGTTTWK